MVLAPTVKKAYNSASLVNKYISFMKRSILCAISLLLFGSALSVYANPAGVPAIKHAELAPKVLTLDLTGDTNDIWDRMQRGFGIPDLDNEMVRQQEAFYLKNPRLLAEIFNRGGQYLHYIVSELERRHMPTEIALLPMVESNYNPLAYSKSHAAGLWQFIPSTGKYYKLTQNTWIDERRDIIASTHAALNYLATIYELHGDWQLTLASYNWGEGAVQRAVRKNLKEGQPGEYSHLDMPFETRKYIPKLQALKNIISHPERYGFVLPHVENERRFVAVHVPGGVDLALAAKLAETPLEDFIALNPSFKRPVITAPGRELIVPAERAEGFVEALSNLPSGSRNWKKYTLQRGESLQTVAARHKLTVNQLKQLNGLHKQKKIPPGIVLLVPDGINPAGALAAARLLNSTDAPQSSKTSAAAAANRNTTTALLAGRRES